MRSMKTILLLLFLVLNIPALGGEREKGANLFLKSLLLPGWGQWSAGHKLRAPLYPLGIIGFLVWRAALPEGDPYRGKGRLWIDATTLWYDSEQEIFIRGYYIGDREVTKEEYYAEKKKREEAEKSRRDARRKKNMVLLGAMGVYVVNLVDAFLISRSPREPKVSLGFDPQPKLTLTYRF